MMTRKVSAKTRRSLRSMPGSCWGFGKSANAVAHCSSFAVRGSRETNFDHAINAGTIMLTVTILDDGIQSALHERMASQKSPDCFRPAPQNPIALDRLHRVF